VNFELFAAGELEGVVSVEGAAALPDRLFIELVPSGLMRAKTSAASSADQPAAKVDNVNDRVGHGFVGARDEFSIGELRSGSYQFRVQVWAPTST